MDSLTQNLLWEDKEIKFDVANLQNQLRNGEKTLSKIQNIEDSKGNPGDKGILLATNLRLIWHSVAHKKYNLSIGYARIVTANCRTVNSKNRGEREALYVLAVASGNSTRFEFLFTDVSNAKTSSRFEEPVFSSIFAIYQQYQRTYLYRDLKLRGAIVQLGQLILLPQEKVYSTLHGVWNLSSDQGNLGSFVVTNIRLVWFADANSTFNISLPFLQIESIRIRESKYGPALVIQTAETGGGYVLGFRIDPQERLNEVFKELCSLHIVYTENPNFGVEYVQGEELATLDNQERNNKVKIDDFEEIDESQEREINSKLNTYLASGNFSANTENKRRDPVYCQELGFSMERIRDGYKLKDLWDVVPSDLIEDDDDDDIENDDDNENIAFGSLNSKTAQLNVDGTAGTSGAKFTKKRNSLQF